MFEHVRHIFVLDQSGQGLALCGDLPDEAERRALLDACQSRPAARRYGEGMALSVPLGGEKWCIWLLAHVPALPQLAPMLTQAQNLCAGLIALRPAAPHAQESVKGTGFLKALTQKVKAAPKNDAVLVRSLAEVMAAKDLGTGLVMWRHIGGRVHKVYASDLAIAAQKSLLRNYLAGLNFANSDAPIALRAGDAGEDNLEASLILDQLGLQEAMILPPLGGGDGWGAIVLGSAIAPKDGEDDPRQFMQLMRPLRVQMDSRAKQNWRRAKWAAAAVLAVFLLWPVPMKITLSGSAVPAEAQAVALRSDAVLQQMHVRVGDQVSADQVLAQFGSHDLNEQLTQERLSVAVEDLNIQAAMAKGEYGLAQLGQQRRDISAYRVAQIEARIAALEVRAPVAGRVISALAPNVAGNAIAAGRDVAQIQTGDGFLMRLTPSPIDLERLRVGMSGHAKFRGLTAHGYDVELLTLPARVMDAQGVEHNEVLAKVSGQDLDKLMAGLTGYARIDGPMAPRIWGLGHYGVEYLRMVTWSYLGLGW